MRNTVLILFLLPASVACAQPLTDTTAEVDHPLKRGQTLLHTGLALGYAGVTYYCYKKKDGRFQEESQEHKTPLINGMAGSVSPLGESRTAWMALGATTGLAYLTRNSRLQHTAMVWAGSLLVNGVVTDQLKGSFQRYRPNAGVLTGSGEGSGLNRSFPSAHTSNAFTTATVFATLYKDKKWVPPLAYGLAAMVGASRVYNNAHWASDVMAGAAVGFLSARAMIATDKWLSRKGIVLYPQVSRRGGAIGMAKSF